MTAIDGVLVLSDLLLARPDLRQALDDLDGADLQRRVVAAYRLSLEPRAVAALRAMGRRIPDPATGTRRAER